VTDEETIRLANCGKRKRPVALAKRDQWVDWVWHYCDIFERIGGFLELRQILWTELFFWQAGWYLLLGLHLLHFLCEICKANEAFGIDVAYEYHCRKAFSALASSLYMLLIELRSFLIMLQNWCNILTHEVRNARLHIIFPSF